MYLRSNHRMQARHFDRISPLTVTLFRSALEPGLLCALAGFSSAFLAVRCLQPDRQSGLVQHIDHTALGVGAPHKKTLNYPIFIGNSRFFVDLHDNHTVQILMRTVRLCVHLCCHFSCKVFAFLLKTFTCLETYETCDFDISSNFFGNLL